MMDCLNVLLHGWSPEFKELMLERTAEEGWAVFQTWNSKDLDALLDHQSIDVAILDVCTALFPGLHWIDTIKARQPEVQVICVTPRNGVGLSISGMRRGAFADLQVPFSWSNLRKKVHAAGKHKSKLLRNKGGSGFWKNIENHLLAACLAEAGAHEMAKAWLEHKQEDDKEKKPKL